MSLIKSFLKMAAIKYGRLITLYKKVCKPQSIEYAEVVKRFGGLHAMGENCRINMHANITDPAFVKIGNNVTLSVCSIFGHDGVIGMLNQAYSVKLDSVGKVVIHDNVYIGHQAIIMPNVTIGPNAIVAAGSVVTGDVLEGDIVGGTPAKVIGRVEDLVVKLQNTTKNLPWYNMIEAREGSFDPKVEDQLRALRVKHFFGEAH